jgi:hypothetical protein
VGKKQVGIYEECKKRIQMLIFNPPIILDRDDCMIKHTLNHTLKFLENLEYFRSMKKKINPHKFIKIIYKVNVIFLVPKIINNWAPYIQKNKIQRCTRMTARLRIGQLMCLAMKAGITHRLDGVTRRTRKLIISNNVRDNLTRMMDELAMPSIWRRLYCRQNETLSGR